MAGPRPQSCGTVQPFVGGFDYFFDGTTYRTPDRLTGDARWTFIEGARPTAPAYLPFTDGDVETTNGWLYQDSTDIHASIDYTRDEQSFEVRAFAAGHVLWQGWDDWHGNVLVLEHGPNLRSLYLHLRNGPTGAWLTQAAAIDPNNWTGDERTKAQRYRRYVVDRGHGGAPALGTAAHRIQVRPGDRVEAHQLIAWAGNTGIGGASAKLRDDGTMPANDTNIHLHFMVAVRHGGDWYFVDPCGAYSSGIGCVRDRGAGAYARWYAPIYPEFHDASASVWQEAHDYYHRMNWGPSDLQYHPSAAGTRISGIIRPRREAQYVHTQLDTKAYDQRWEEYRAKGYRPHKHTVHVGADGKPRFGAIWRRTRGEGWRSWRSLTGAQFDAKVTELAREGFRLADFCVYPWNGDDHRIAAIWVGDRREHQAWWKIEPAKWQAKFDALTKAGFALTHFDACRFGDQTRFGGIWTKGLGGSWLHYAQLDAAGYQSKFDELGRKGWTLVEVRAYERTRRFSGIWARGVDPELHLG